MLIWIKLSIFKLIQKPSVQTENANILPDPVKTTHLSKVIFNATVTRKRALHLTSLWIPENHETRIQQLLCHPIKLLIRIFWIFKNPQTLAQKRKVIIYPELSSVRLMEIKKKEQRINFAFFGRKDLQHRRVNVKIATWESWLVTGSPEQGLEFCRFPRTPTVIICRCKCLFLLPDFYRQLVQVFPIRIFFCSRFLMILWRNEDFINNVFVKCKNSGCLAT